MKSEESTSKQNKKKINGNTKKVLLVFAVVLVLALIAVPLFKGLKKAITDDVPEGFATYNASRYFFRVDYPEEWPYEREQNGFLMDDDSGLVVRINPSESVSVSFFYKAGKAELQKAFEEFKSEHKEYTFGKSSPCEIEECKTEMIQSDIESESGAGKIYVAVRSMAHYAIIVEYTDEKEFKKVEKDVKTMLQTFRLTVFNDKQETTKDE